MSHTDVQMAAGRLLDELERAIVGKRPVLELIVTALFADGHILLEDVPGVAKTAIARALAEAAGLRFARVQFTPDLIPADITGATVLAGGNGEPTFQPGPVFANLVLGDEINRAPPKTQSALLEAMEERQVTADAVTRPLPEPFLVIGTQNPIEQEGTYPLPEAQLDRFLIRTAVGYPGRDHEVELLMRRSERAADRLTLQPVSESRRRGRPAETGGAGARLTTRRAVCRGSRRGHENQSPHRSRSEPPRLPGAAQDRARPSGHGRPVPCSARRHQGGGRALPGPPAVASTRSVGAGRSHRAGGARDRGPGAGPAVGRANGSTASRPAPPPGSSRPVGSTGRTAGRSQHHLASTGAPLPPPTGLGRRWFRARKSGLGPGIRAERTIDCVGDPRDPQTEWQRCRRSNGTRPGFHRQSADRAAGRAGATASGRAAGATSDFVKR